MPTFPQFALESFVAFTLLLGYCRLAAGRHGSFRAKRWQLRLVPLLACLLPLLPALFAEEKIEVPTGVNIMSIGQFFDFQLPEFSINIGTLLLAVYFVGVMVTAFRLADRIWLASQFLQKNGNNPAGIGAWQSQPSALIGHLLLNWPAITEADRAQWATKWLPIHPIYGWEVLLVELSVVGNWWNPLAYRYRQSWAALYAERQVERSSAVGFSWASPLGFAALTAGLASIFALLPASASPSHRLGKIAFVFLNKTVFENNIEKPHDYTLAWGEVKLPLKKFANPNGYSADLEVELADFQRIIDQELKIYRDGEPLKPGTLSIMYKSNLTGTHAYVNGIDPKNVKLLDRHNGTVFNDSLGLGDELVLFGDTEDIYISKVEIRIKDPNAGYEPSFFVPQISELEATMYFQIVARHGQRALVKIDPDHPNSPRVLQLYSDARKYEIVRIPGFRTNRHYLTEAESLSSKVAAAATDLTFMERDAYYLPEYLGCQGKVVRLVWGQMEAAPSNYNYPLDSFLMAANQEPVLLVGDDTLTIASFEVVIAGKGRPAHSFQTYRIGDLGTRGAFEGMQEETSIYFEKVVVYDAEHNRKLFPASFAFNIGEQSKGQLMPPHMKGFMLSFGEKTEVIRIGKFNHISPDSMKKAFQKRIEVEK